MGPYCLYCGRRCFVLRTSKTRSEDILMATCSKGAEADQEKLGETYLTAVNPYSTIDLTPEA